MPALSMPTNPTFTQANAVGFTDADLAVENVAFWALFHRLSPECPREHLGELWGVIEDAVCDAWEAGVSTEALERKAIRLVRKRRFRLDTEGRLQRLAYIPT